MPRDRNVLTVAALASPIAGTAVLLQAGNAITGISRGRIATRALLLQAGNADQEAQHPGNAEQVMLQAIDAGQEHQQEETARTALLQAEGADQEDHVRTFHFSHYLVIFTSFARNCLKL